MVRQKRLLSDGKRARRFLLAVALAAMFISALPPASKAPFITAPTVDLVTSSNIAGATNAVYTFHAENRDSVESVSALHIRVPAGYSINATYLTNLAGIVVMTGVYGRIGKPPSGTGRIVTTAIPGRFDVYSDSVLRLTSTIVAPTATTPGDIGALLAVLNSGYYADFNTIPGFFINPSAPGVYVWGPNTATPTAGTTVAMNPRSGFTNEVAIAASNFLTTVFTNTSCTLGFMLTGNIYDDSGMGFIYAHRSPPKLIFPKTDTSKVSPTGQPTWSGYTHLVTVGGRNANPTTRYYEDNGLALLRAVVNLNGTISIMRGSNATLNVALSSVTQSNDYFTLQVFAEGTHKVIVVWGITEYGTYASGIYFDGIFLSTLAQGWYIVRWQDLNGNGIPDYAGEFSVVASGI